MTNIEMKQRIVRTNQMRFWIIFPALLGVFTLIIFMSINDVLGTALLFLGVVIVGLGLGYFAAGHKLNE
jgi:hypothetical protein